MCIRDRYYGLSERDFGVDLLSYRRKGEEEGTFLMLLAPKWDWAEHEVMRKSIVFVLDTSGSMQGPKIEQARGALRFFLRSLRPEDQFDVIPFATEPRPFFGRRVDASPDNLDRALAKVDRIQAQGGTNIAGALGLALAGSGAAGDRVPIVVFLTDGKPTVGAVSYTHLTLPTIYSV